MAAPIQPSDDTRDKFSKLIPADVAAAFISTKSALVSLSNGATSTVITFVVILCLCPLYFTKVSKITDSRQKFYLWASSLIFAFSLASKEITTLGINVINANPWLKIDPTAVDPSVSALAIVLPILWTSIVSQIAATAFEGTRENPPPRDRPAAKPESTPAPGLSADGKGG